MRNFSSLILLILLIGVIFIAGCTGSTESTEANKIAQAIDYLNNPVVHNFALQQVQHSSTGYYNIAQICDVWQTIYNQWTYVSDPPNFNYWTSASDSINNGLKGNCADYATLNAAVIDSIGGSSRVVTACAPGGSPCHAYAEVYLGNTQSDLQKATDYICSRYMCGGSGISYHSYPDAQGNTEYWLNLDWSANFPGGSFFQDDGTYHVFYSDGSYYDTTCAGGNPCTITEHMNGQILLVSPTAVAPITTPTPDSAALLSLKNALNAGTPTPTPNFNLLDLTTSPTPDPAALLVLNSALIEEPTSTPALDLNSIYPITVVNDLVTIPYNSNEAYDFSGNSGNAYHISISATSPVNILVMDPANYNIYQNAFKSGSAVTFNHFVSYQTVKSEGFDYILPNTGRYYVVIDNSPFITGSVSSKTSVLASTKILLTGHL